MSIKSMELERVYALCTVSGRLRSSAPHMRSVLKDDIRQRHLPDRFLKMQGMSTFAIVSPICCDKATIIFVYAGFGTRRPQTLI